jgi:hypothetical protein
MIIRLILIRDILILIINILQTDLLVYIVFIMSPLKYKLTQKNKNCKDIILKMVISIVYKVAFRSYYL